MVFKSRIAAVGKAYTRAQDTCLGYLRLVEEYLHFWIDNDRITTEEELHLRSFSEKISPDKEYSTGGITTKDTLLKIQPLGIEYKMYFHTEYLLYYRLFHDLETAKTEFTYFASYYDMCDRCERLWAQVSREIKVVSKTPFYDSRTRVRPKEQTNEHLVLYQLTAAKERRVENDKHFKSFPPPFQRKL